MSKHEYPCDLIVIGGAALALLGVVDRPTRDCAVVDPLLDARLIQLAQDFSRQQTACGQFLSTEWLNNGPQSLAAVLPVGWRSRVALLFSGRTLRLRVLGRSDLLASKLWALCDRGIDMGDCMALAPTPVELSALRTWLHAQDLNPDWPRHIDDTLADLGRRLKHGF